MLARISTRVIAASRPSLKSFNSNSSWRIRDTRPSVQSSNAQLKAFREQRSFSLDVQYRFASNLKYTKDHEWIKVENSIGTIGITDFAQNALGEVVYVDLPDVGRKVQKKETVIAVESVKVIWFFFLFSGRS